jgi:hypothetical protein
MDERGSGQQMVEETAEFWRDELLALFDVSGVVPEHVADAFPDLAEREEALAGPVLRRLAALLDEHAEELAT